jgi:hypothetical protein
VKRAPAPAAAAAKPAVRPQASRYLAMATPAASMTSFALALRAGHWREACLHQATLGAGGMTGCIASMRANAKAAAKLRLTVRDVRVQGAEAVVSYSTTVGSKYGLALLEHVKSRWLIVGLKPCSGPSTC